MKYSVTRKYRLSLGMALAFLLLAILVACGPGEEPTPAPTPTQPAAVATPTPTPTGPAVVASPTPTPGVQFQRGGKLEFVISAIPPSFDPQLLSIGYEIYQTNSKLYNNLFVNYEGITTECELCSDKGWRLENSGKTMVFDIRPGIKFHSGKELTTADLVYSLKMISGEIDGIVSPRAGAFKEYWQSIEAPSKYELRINLVRPSPFVPKILAISAASIYEDGTTRASLQNKDAGSGPFLMKRAVPGSVWQMVRNPDYFKSGQPYLDEVEFTATADLTTRIAAFMIGRQLWSPWAFQDPQYKPQLDKLEAEGKIVRYVERGASAHPFVGMNNARPPFNDIRMRQAVNLALDRKAIIAVSQTIHITPFVVSLLTQNPTEEFGTPPEKVWDIIPGWGTGAKKQEEIEQAKRLVIAAGYPSGISGLKFIGSSPPSLRTPTEFEQQLLAKVGINTKLSLLDSNQRSNAMANMDYDLNSYGWAITTKDPDEIMSYWIEGGSRNWVGYSNPEVNKLYIQMSSEMDPIKRKELFLRIQDIIVVKDVVWAPLAGDQNLMWGWAKLQGVTIGMSIHSASGFHRGDRLWLKQ